MAFPSESHDEAKGRGHWSAEGPAWLAELAGGQADWLRLLIALLIYSWNPRSPISTAFSKIFHQQFVFVQLFVVPGGGSNTKSKQLAI